MSEYFCLALGKDHDRHAFRCGASELDRYLQQQAGQDLRKRVAAVFVMVPKDEPQKVAGYYTLSSASIVLGDLPPELIKNLPRYPIVPAVLLGRLARDVSFPGIGKFLLLDALTRAHRHASDVASAVVLVDAKNDAARLFYAKYGFQTVHATSSRMFLPMKTVEQLIPTGNV